MNYFTLMSLFTALLIDDRKAPAEGYRIEIFENKNSGPISLLVGLLIGLMVLITLMARWLLS